MNISEILQEIYEETKQINRKGTLPGYIPELRKISPDKLAIHLFTLEGKSYGIGDNKEKFSLQSIAKVFAFTYAYSLLNNRIFNHVGVEPSGDPFNSLVQLEKEKGVPRNPLINSGALVICDLLISELENPRDDLLEFIRKISVQPRIDYNEKVYQSEKATGHRNRAMVHLMKSFGTIKNDTEEVLDLYFRLCSIEMTTEELAKTFLLYANGGVIPDTGERIINSSQTKRTNAIMQTCGFYDEAGEFSFRVGLPGKSGVGGGIAAVHPGKYAVATWSPLLNEKGNSEWGMKALELLTTKTGWSVF
jgi:glutaminase